MKNTLIVIGLLILSISQVLAQGKLEVELKGAPKPDVYIDGKKYDHDIFELLDKAKIESINVLKGEEAMNEYNAPNGVILVETKKEAQETEQTAIRIRGGDPVVFIDGKESNKETLATLSPDEITSIDVVKGEKALDEYNAPNGAIIIKTKKKKESGD